VVNQTGRPVLLVNPVSSSIANEARIHFLSPVLNQRIDIIYSIGRWHLLEPVNMGEQDIIVTLTRDAPTLTVVNNVGATIITIFLRFQNTTEWIGGNIVTRDGEVQLASGASTTELTGSIVNRDSMRIWLGNIPNELLTGSIFGVNSRFDVRIDDVNGVTYVRSNVQITNDMTITFTAADRR
jgi:hypothetical protein